MNVSLDTLELEKTCPDCQGERGRRHPHVNGGNVWISCGTCNGEGIVTTEMGKAILKFVANRLVAGRDGLRLRESIE